MFYREMKRHRVGRSAQSIFWTPKPVVCRNYHFLVDRWVIFVMGGLLLFFVGSRINKWDHNFTSVLILF